MHDVTYAYTLLPDEVLLQRTDNMKILDLNVSSHFHVLFPDACDTLEQQMQRWEQIKSNVFGMDLIAHLIVHAEQVAQKSELDYYQERVMTQLRNGVYGTLPKHFFINQDPQLESARKCILNHLAIQEKYGNKSDLFESVLKEIFGKQIIFYFDTIKRKLYTVLIPEKTERYEQIVSVCIYLFADILIPVEVRWNCYPVIIGKTYYVAAAENEQRCGTIV